MVQEKVSSLAVLNDDGTAAGIVTERDFVRRICAAGKNSSDVKIVEILSAPVRTVGVATPIGEAANFMIQNRVRHLLVVEGSQTKKPVGIISATDIVASLKENSADMKQADKEVLNALESEGRFYF
jgi:signal-transduction protein with cAMP-binding, CBS, and nucleotidyltransferase domain